MQMNEFQLRLRELFQYENGNFYWKVNKGTAKIGQKANRDGGKYNQIKFDGKRYWFHRIVFYYQYGYFPKTVDHINGNKFDNRIENLREANYSENNSNRHISKRNITGIKNVFWNNKKNKWTVSVENKSKNLKFVKSFDDLELAELVAIEARNKIHGNFANHGYQLDGVTE